MKFLMVATNNETSPFPVAPLGALTVAAAVRHAGIKLDFLDMSFQKDPARTLRKALKKTKYDVIGFSIRNLDDCSYLNQRSFYDVIKKQVRVVRECSQAPLILGGCGFSVHPRGWMQRLLPDCGIIGEGEQVLVKVLNCLEQKKSLSGIPGVILTADQIFPDPVWSQHLNKFASPAHELCKYKPHLKRGGFVSIQTRRGCPCHCIYCVYQRFEGESFRLRDPQLIADEMKSIIDHQGTRCFFFTDSVFNMPREHALKICRALIDRKLDLGWMAYVNPVGFDNKLAGLMKEAGCVGLEFGLDALNDKMLKSLGKPFGQSEIKQALGAVGKADIPMAVHLLLGGPGETVADIETGQEFLDTCATPNAVFASIGLRIYDNTELKRIALEEGVIDEDTDLFEPTYYLSALLGENPIAAIDQIVCRRPEWSSPCDWNKPLLKLIQTGINHFGGRPQWRNVRNYGKYMRQARTVTENKTL